MSEAGAGEVALGDDQRWPQSKSGDCGVAADCGLEDRKICGAEREGSGPVAQEAVSAGGKSRGWKRHEGVYRWATVVGVCSVCALVNVSAERGAVGAFPSI